MHTLRKGKEKYSELYAEAMKMHEMNLPIKKIAQELKVSYSAVYAWLRQGRQPAQPSLVKFREYLQKNGPRAAIDVKKIIPKHNEFYHIAQKRGIGIKRVILDKRYAEYSVWYYLEGQELLLKERLDDLRGKYEKVKKKLMNTLGI